MKGGSVKGGNTNVTNTNDIDIHVNSDEAVKTGYKLAAFVLNIFMFWWWEF